MITVVPYECLEQITGLNGKGDSITFQSDQFFFIFFVYSLNPAFANRHNRE